MALNLGSASRASLLLGVISLVGALWYYDSNLKIDPPTLEHSEDGRKIKGVENRLPDGTYIDLESDFARDYATARTTIEKDIEILRGMLEHVTLLVKDFAGLPLADNRDFTRLLTGANKQKFAWCHPDHSSINEEGELTDRWGTTLFFHRESALRTGIRSAGADRKMWTDDDVAFSPSAFDP